MILPVYNLLAYDKGFTAVSACRDLFLEGAKRDNKVIVSEIRATRLTPEDDPDNDVRWDAVDPMDPYAVPPVYAIKLSAIVEDVI